MVISRIDGGSGNQILAFAAAYALAKETNKELILDISAVCARSRGYALDWFSIPNLKKIVHRVSEIKEIKNIAWLETLEDINNEIQIYDNEGSGNSLEYWGLEQSSAMKSQRNIYLNGYFFNRDKFFLKYWDEIRKMFMPKEFQEEVEEFKALIANKISIGVHVRRGDLVLTDWAVKLEDDYFRATITYCKEVFPNCLFCIFSDDIEYVKNILGLDSSYYYVHFMGTDTAALSELICLSLCTHRILSNSSTYSAVADALNWEENRKTFRRAECEDKINESSIDFSKRHIVVGDKDIDYYAKVYYVDNRCNIENYLQKQTMVVNTKIDEFNCKYVLDLIIELSLNAYNRDASLEMQILFKKFLCHVYMKQYKKALQNVFPLYMEYADNVEFNKGLRKALHFIEAYEEEIVESVRIGLEIEENIFNNEQESYYKVLMKKLKKNNGKRMHFLMVPAICNSVAFQSLGLAELAQVLVHLGHKVSYVYEPGNDMEKEMIEEGTIKSELGYNVGYNAYLYDSVRSNGIERFFDELEEEELIVVSRKAEMFIEKNRVDKRLYYVFPDFSDERDAETFYAVTQIGREELDDLYSRADIVLTKDDDVMNKLHTAVFWEDNDIGKWILTEKRLGLERTWRLSKRGIGMAASLIDALK